MTQGQGICNTICFKGQLCLVLRENSVLTSISEIPRWRLDLKGCIYITKEKCGIVFIMKFLSEGAVFF